MKILIVDDLEDARVMMHKLLENMGHNVEIAVNGLHGLDMAREFQPDLIFTDVMMPVMDGFQLCRTVNDDANLRHIPVIIHSATFDDAEDKRLAMESGAVSFIKKPVSEIEFIDIVNKMIKRFESGELNHSRQQSVSSEELDIMHYRSLVNKLYKKTEALEHEIVSRKNAYELLKINEDRYRSLLNNAPNVVVCMTGEHFITEFNKEAERIYGHTRADVIGKDYLELFVPKEYHKNVAADIQKVLGGEPTFGYENPVINKDGSKRILLWNVTNMLNGEGKAVGVVAMGVDITELRILERAVIDFEEHERQRIGHDLHDDVGQLMTGLGFKTQSLLEKLKDINGGLYSEGEEISELVEQAKNKLRHLTKGLLPVDLSNMGLVEAIEGLVSDINKLFDIKCDFNYMDHFNINNEGAIINLYRIVQEASTNALKHATADKIEISLDRSDNNVTMIIKDNGIGIPESVLSRGGIGLKIMGYRSRLINATLNIYKDGDHGTVVKCVMKDS